MNKNNRKTKRDKGVTNAYILNFMIHSDTWFMNATQIKRRVNKRFYLNYRTNDLVKYHLKPLVARHWLYEINGKYDTIYCRFGGLNLVEPLKTLQDQFYYMKPEEMNIFIENFEDHWDEYWSSLDLIDNLTEKEYDEEMEREYDEYIKLKNEFEPELSKEGKGKLKDFLKELDI